jgi:hypothetical protein
VTTWSAFGIRRTKKPGTNPGFSFQSLHSPVLG